MSFNWINDNKNYLIYVGDALCSWCYGFTNELDEVINSNPNLEMKLIMGGLRPYNTEKAIDMVDFLKHHWDEVNKRTGQPFSYDILKDDTFIYDTEPASRAIVVARNIDPKIEYDFFKAVQVAFYKDSKNTNNIETYLSLASHFNLDEDTFKALYNSEEIKAKTKADFELTAQLGVRGFPSLILKLDNQFIRLSNGYALASSIDKSIEEAFKN